MSSTNRKRTLLVSGAVILLCMAIIFGMSYALFTDTETVGSHLKAGKLDITLERTKLTSTYLTNRGFLDTKTDTTIKDFTNNRKENVFDLDGGVIVPRCKYEAEMKITNNSTSTKSNVAFVYWIEIVYTGKADVDLADQIEVVVTTTSGTQKKLSEGLTVGSSSNPVGILAVGASATFTVSIEFLDIETGLNNLAQGDEVSFDLCVHAVQYTGADPLTS